MLKSEGLSFRSAYRGAQTLALEFEFIVCGPRVQREVYNSHLRFGVGLRA